MNKRDFYLSRKCEIGWRTENVTESLLLFLSTIKVGGKFLCLYSDFISLCDFEQLEWGKSSENYKFKSRCLISTFIEFHLECGRGVTYRSRH